ncbi:unnamed protein product, partial [Adineta steineri]
VLKLITDANETADKVFVIARQLIGNNYLDMNEITVVGVDNINTNVGENYSVSSLFEDELSNTYMADGFNIDPTTTNISFYKFREYILTFSPWCMVLASLDRLISNLPDANRTQYEAPTRISQIINDCIYSEVYIILPALLMLIFDAYQTVLYNFLIHTVRILSSNLFRQELRRFFYHLISHKQPQEKLSGTKIATTINNN